MNVIENSASTRSTPPVTINNVALPTVEVDGQRVVTLAMVDRVHGRPEGTASRNFREHRGKLIEGEDYRELTADEIRRQSLGSVFPPRTPKGIVLTETGYLMIVKPFSDDLAWKVQRQLVSAYFKRPAPAFRPTSGPRMDVSREHRLMMREQVRWAKMAGLAGNQALLAANRATVRLTGIDNLGLLGVSQLDAPQNTALLSPTDIGDRAGIGSPQTVNNRLCALGLQLQFRGRRGKAYYEPTEAGIAAGAVMVDVGKKDGAGIPVRQLRWSSAILRHLEGADARHH